MPRKSEASWMRANFNRHNSIISLVGSPATNIQIDEKSENSVSSSSSSENSDSSDSMKQDLSDEEGLEDIAVSTQAKLKNIRRKNTILENISREDIRLVYTFTKKLGEGSFGTVRIAHKTVNPGENFAIKSIPRERVLGELVSLSSELGLLLAADHPFIVKLIEIYLDHKYIHLVTELLAGGEVDPAE